MNKGAGVNSVGWARHRYSQRYRQARKGREGRYRDNTCLGVSTLNFAHTCSLKHSKVIFWPQIRPLLELTHPF